MCEYVQADVVCIIIIIMICVGDISLVGSGPQKIPARLL